MRDYDYSVIEKKWQEFWNEHQTFCCTVDEQKPKYYVLDMFPYPSGSGLHIGHTVGYMATDIVARYKRMTGFNVLHPMGWDSFGLPAERYAVRMGVHPSITTKQNTDTFRRQLKSLGFSYDWNREISTCDPSYYKWTQWIFTKLYEKGLAYEAEVPVNFCPALGTVLANEEVEGGKSTEGGHDVIRLPLKQWMLRITTYADRLLEDLSLLDWPESLKALQRHWIGRSEGVSVDFPVAGTKDRIPIFTTRADTLFGVTFIVVAPEHPLVAELTTSEHASIVEAYVQASRGKSDFERTEGRTEKTGVFTGGFCIHPATGEKIPVWVADYVLPTYGTGAVMGVPAHDARDYVFAMQYHFPMKHVIAPVQGYVEEAKAFEDDGVCVDSQSDKISIDGLSSEQAREKIADWLTEAGMGRRTIQYKLRDWLFSRQRYWGEPIPIIHREDGTQRALDLGELPLLPPHMVDFVPTGDGSSPLAKVPEWVNIIDPVTGMPAKRETNTMPQWAGSCWYYLRFCDPHNDKAAWDRCCEQYWLPVDLYVGGAEHATSHLLYSRFWHKVLFDCGLVSKPEPFVSLRNQGLVVARSYKDRHGKYLPPEEVEERNGVYFRAGTQEVLTSQIEKMSKSKLNGVPPDELIKEYGADAYRLAITFIGPLEKEKVWNTDVLIGCRRFLSRVYEMVTGPKVQPVHHEALMRRAHRLVAKARQDLDALQFNTIIAKMMEFVNEVQSYDVYPVQAMEWFVQVLTLFAPHVGEELWHHLGHSTSVVEAAFPVPDPQYLVDEVVTYVIQVDGKVRGRLELPKDRSDEEVTDLALAHPNVARFLDGKRVEKTIVIPNKLLNIVTKRL
jgi:leucyl-tRNA synthetase